MSDENRSGYLLKALKDLVRHYVILMESGRDRIVSLGGQCDPVDVMERGDPYLRQAKEAIAKAGRDDEKPSDYSDLRVTDFDISAQTDSLVDVRPVFVGTAMCFLVEHLARWFKDTGATNYVTLNVTNGESEFEITMQRVKRSVASSGCGRTTTRGTSASTSATA